MSLRRVVPVLVLLASAACGIPADRSAEPLAGGVVVPAVDPANPLPSGTPAGEGGAAAPVTQVGVFLVEADRVVEVVRAAAVTGLGPALELLLEGPTEAELAAGIRTAVPPGTALRSARVDAGTALIDLTSTLVEVGGQEQILAVAQFVLTATALDGIERVRVALDGQAVEVPRADGTLTPGPLTAADFASLRASPGG